MSAFDATREHLQQVAQQLRLQPDRRQRPDRRAGPRRGGRRATDLLLDPIEVAVPDQEIDTVAAANLPEGADRPTERTVLSMVDQHSCEVLGTVYAAVPKWVAVQHSQTGTPRYLLCVEFSQIADLGEGPGELRLLVSFSDVSELPALLNEALEHRLVADRMPGLSEPPSRASVQQWLEALWPDRRYPGSGGLPN